MPTNCSCKDLYTKEIIIIIIIIIITIYYIA